MTMNPPTMSKSHGHADGLKYRSNPTPAKKAKPPVIMSTNFARRIVIEVAICPPSWRKLITDGNVIPKIDQESKKGWIERTGGIRSCKPRATVNFDWQNPSPRAGGATSESNFGERILLKKSEREIWLICREP